MALFLGIDCSTQSMTGVVIQSDEPSQSSSPFTLIASASFQFDKRLPHYGTTKGVLTSNGHVEVPSLMFVEALELLLQDLTVELDKSGHAMSQIRAVSGCAQQHTSVFWRVSSLKLPQDGRLHAFLKEQRAFDPENGRSWMDSSTTSHCKALEAALGGSQHVADITGSRAYERFTGVQLMALWGQVPSRVSLASSLLTSLFLGQLSSVEHSDASGMNVMDVRSRKWSAPIMDAMEAIGGVPLGT
ncbi:hypothetical protein AaE_005816, partial [Aphanomyces astaci]